jgi:hypothetical protein
MVHQPGIVLLVTWGTVTEKDERLLFVVTDRLPAAGMVPDR